MNRNRLSTNLLSHVDREQMYSKINRLLLDGKKYIKNLNRCLGVIMKNISRLASHEVIDADKCCVLYNFKSTRSCAS